MEKIDDVRDFATFFKKYRLRSEIDTLTEFGNLLADEGIVYENSIYSRWQNGTRLPKNRQVLLQIVKVFIKKGGIRSFTEVNMLLESAGQGYVTKQEYSQVSRIME